MLPKLKVLFLCTRNSCRSHMAETWTRQLKGRVIEAYSAGIDPGSLDPLAVRVMSEAGAELPKQRAKHLDEVREVRFDYVVTVCDHAQDHCPILAGNVKIVHVSFEDPAKLAASTRTGEERLGHYRRVRDEIRTFAERFPGPLSG